jgi:hypothetical protein
VGDNISAEYAPLPPFCAPREARFLAKNATPEVCKLDPDHARKPTEFFAAAAEGCPRRPGQLDRLTAIALPNKMTVSSEPTILTGG